ncbi:aldehyde dehydrogenase [Paraburkholderia caribensis]|uniref:aldehyde dehydrogenase n=1 Tax=Paraburkholderia caribensis TaxID=75105 RepID=UPI001CB600F3|nr:aldehyde dehydrogenase [Paraburkholderia caribensis]CAG9263161.1 NAD-dependent aldehyde dehydrogenase [Paraburkholderia caribensis]
MVKKFLVGAEWRDSGRTFDSIFPGDGSVTAQVAAASEQDVDDAVRAARDAMSKSAWRDMPAHHRGRLLARMADLIDRDSSMLADLQTRDNGKPLAESEAQVAAAAEFFRYYASVCETSEGQVVPSRGNYFSFVDWEPVGVVASITPWNSPLTHEAQKLAPALAAGNTVIMKSSEVTPQVGLEYGRLALEAGFPAGVLNVVTGLGDVGKALVSHPGVNMISFTGGTETGRAIGAIAGRRTIPAILELGGKSPNIIFADANLDLAVQGSLVAIFHNAGQSCLAGSRVFVERSIYDKFVDRFVGAASALALGDPYDRHTAVATVSSFEHRSRIENWFEVARKEGAAFLCGGRRPSGGAFERGAYIEPTVLATTNDMTIAHEEIFGPVACVIPFDDEAQLIRLANESPFGLAAGVWTEDYRRALTVGRRVNAGTVWINTYKSTAVNMPFGGNKASGVGREAGVDGMQAYMVRKAYYLSLDRQPASWPPA